LNYLFSLYGDWLTWVNATLGGVRLLKVPMSNVTTFASAAHGPLGQVSTTTAGDGIEWGIPTTDGTRITSVSADVVPGAGCTLSLQLWVVTPNVSHVQVGSTITSSGTALQTLTLSGLTIDIVNTDRKTYVLQVTQTVGTTASGIDNVGMTSTVL